MIKANLEMNFDVLIKDGFIVDGTGGPWYKADIGIKNRKISDIGTNLATKSSDIVIDAKGHVVSSGFFDMHAHSELTYFKHPTADNKILQGITTEVSGNCGGNLCGPIKGMAIELLKKSIEKEEIPVEGDWNSLAGYMDKLEKVGGTSVNSAFLVGFGTVRMSVIGYEKGPPNAVELKEMKEMVAEGMDDGAFGLSTGQQYPPQNYAEVDEIVELAKVVARYGGYHQSHIRRRGWTADEKYGRAFLKPMRDTMLEAIRECIEIGERAGIPTVWSHAKIAGGWGVNSGKANEFLKLVEDARQRGVDITIDTWADTYTAMGPNKVAPLWAWEGGLDKFVERLKEPELRAKIRPFAMDALGQGCEINWEQTLIWDASLEKNKEFIGKTFGEVAKSKGMEIVDLYLDLVSEGEKLSIQGPWGGGEEDNIQLIKHPLSLFGTDSGCSNHDEKKQFGYGLYKGTGFGLFPRVLRKYVREERIISLEEAIRKMTSASANRLGLHDRGLIKPGFWADIVIFDPISISENPLMPPSGIPYVLVNGMLTVENGKHTGVKAGKSLKHKSHEGR
jgi:N-acyl-D-amino-acid deacylase